MSSPTPRRVWDALALARAEREAALLADHDDDIGGLLAERDRGPDPDPPEAA